MASLGFHLRRACLGLGLLALAASAAAQSDTPPLEMEVLSAREATKLLVNQVKPDYPAVAHANYIEGQVQMELMVGPDGHVRKAHVLRGHPLLAASALKATHRWVYRPFTTAAGPRAFSTQVKVIFDLRKQRSLDREHFPAAPAQDLQRRVTLPEVLERPLAPRTAPSIRLHVLVGDDGRVIDSSLVSGPVALFQSAQNSVAQWQFQPARWGNLAVPWYLDIDVPVASPVPSTTSRLPERP